MGSHRSEVTSGRRKFDELAPKPVTIQETVDSRKPLAFGPFILDPEAGRLLEGERVIPLAPKPFETLHYLAQRRGRVIPKSELMEKLWPETFVTDDVLVQSVVDIRRALGDHAKTPQYVETIPRRGYRFLAEVRAQEGTTHLEVDNPGPGIDHGEPTPAPLEAAPAPRRLWAWLALLALAAAAIATLWLRSNRQVASAFAPEPGSLVVMPVLVEEPVPQSGWLRQGLAEMIRTQLGQTPGMQVVARHRLAAALADAGFDEEKGPTGPVAAQVARSLRAEKLITGSFVRFDDRFALNAQVVDVASGRTEGNASVRGKHPADLLEAVDELCLKLLHNLGPVSRAGDTAWRPTRLTTRSVEASKFYVEALGRLTRGGRAGAESAEALLDKALALDPSFAQAYVKKAEIQHWRRRWGYGDPDPAPAIQAAARLLKELPDRERLLVKSFEAFVVLQQPSVALRDWNALLQFYPTYAQELGIPGLVTETFLAQGRWDQIILVAEAHVESPSLPDAERARLSSLLSQAFRRKGEFDRALREAQRAMRLWPTREGPAFLHQRTILGRIELDAGRQDQAVAEFEAVAQARDADATNLTNAAWGLYMAGDAERAAALVDRALKQDASYGNAYHLRGWMELARREHTAAAASLLLAYERTPRHFGNPYQGLASGDLAALYYAGVAYQKLGAGQQAKAAFERLREQCRKLAERSDEEAWAARWQAQNFLARIAARLRQPGSEPPRLEGDDTTYFVQTARLHAVQGRREAAMRELAQGVALGHGELRHIADDPDFESLRSEAEFKRLVAPPTTR